MKAIDVIQLAEQEIGYIGKKSDADLDDKTANIEGKYTKYARDLYAAGYYNGNKNGYDWCAVFVDWLFYVAAGRDKDKAMAVKPTDIYGAGVKWAWQTLENKGMTGNEPREGAQIFFDGDTAKFVHTGIVVGVYGDIVETIEGNWNNRVCIRQHRADDKKIHGYGYPAYEEPPVKVGDICELKDGAHCYTSTGIDRGYGFSTWVYEAQVMVGELSEDGTLAHITTDFTLESYTGWARVEDLVVTHSADDGDDDDGQTDDGVSIQFPTITPESDPEMSVVIVLQTLLDGYGYGGNGERLALTGLYDDATVYAVNAYKRHIGLAQNGIVDSETWVNLFNAGGLF